MRRVGEIFSLLREAAAVLTGSAGETFSGPQSGIIVWNDPDLTERSRTPFSLSWPRLIRSTELLSAYSVVVTPRGGRAIKFR
jgi:glycine/serine hydroxymethyltransferase